MTGLSVCPNSSQFKFKLLNKTTRVFHMGLCLLLAAFFSCLHWMSIRKNGWRTVVPSSKGIPIVFIIIYPSKKNAAHYNHCTFVYISPWRRKGTRVMDGSYSGLRIQTISTKNTPQEVKTWSTDNTTQTGPFCKITEIVCALWLVKNPWLIVRYFLAKLLVMQLTVIL